MSAFVEFRAVLKAGPTGLFTKGRSSSRSALVRSVNAAGRLGRGSRTRSSPRTGDADPFGSVPLWLDRVEHVDSVIGGRVAQRADMSGLHDAASRKSRGHHSGWRRLVAEWFTGATSIIETCATITDLNPPNMSDCWKWS